MNIKHFFLIIHRWFGLIAGMHFVLLGISGSYLVYGDFFEKNLFKERYEIQKERPELSFEEVILKTQALLQLEDPPTAISFPKNKKESIAVTYNIPNASKPYNPILNFYDPIQNKILDSVSYRETLKGFMFFFHHDLFMGKTGRVIMGVSGILCMLLLITGLYLWIPKRKKFKEALYKIRFKNLLTFTLDTHKILGFYTFLLMVLVTFTGLYITVPQWFGQGRAPSPAQEKTTQRELSRLEIFKMADQTFLEKEGISMMFHPRAKKFFVNADNNYIFDEKTLSFNPRETGSPNLRRTMGALHEGDFWQEVGPFLIFVSGILPLFFYLSGIYLWIKKSKFRVL